VKVLTNCEGRSGVRAAIAALKSGRSAMDAVEAGVRATEADVRVLSVGRGGLTDVLGNVTCDAAVMDGRTLEAGAVGCLSGYLHAVSVARKVMERLPHVFLVGAGANRFAGEVGAEPAEMLTKENRGRHQRWLARHVPESNRSRLQHGPLARYAWESTRKAGGTVVFLAIDRKGNLAGATSTSGWAYRYPGRLGDSPVIGAGLYVDNRYGACGCTHVGEMTIRCGTARSVVLYMKGGASVEEAVAEAMADLNELRHGFTGAVMIHAIDADGRACALSRTDVKAKLVDHYWNGNGRAMKLRAPVARR
jgi:L-asparaginase